LRREPLDLVERTSVRANDVEKRQRDDDQERRHQDGNLAHDAVVNRLVLLCRFLLHPVVQHEELRNHPDELHVLRADRRAQASDSRILVRLGDPEHLVDQPPEAIHCRQQALLLRRRTLSRRQRFLERDGLRQVHAQSIEDLLPRHQRVGLHPIRHIAHRRRQPRQVVLDPEELEGVFAVPLADRRLLVAQGSNLAHGVQADAADGRQ
jgi:hypothetical protein